jgi:hypothetical protein
MMSRLEIIGHETIVDSCGQVVPQFFERNVSPLGFLCVFADTRKPRSLPSVWLHTTQFNKRQENSKVTPNL